MNRRFIFHLFRSFASTISVRLLKFRERQPVHELHRLFPLHVHRIVMLLVITSQFFSVEVGIFFASGGKSPCKKVSTALKNISGCSACGMCPAPLMISNRALGNALAHASDAAMGIGSAIP